jgi:hypothetical protein
MIEITLGDNKTTVDAEQIKLVTLWEAPPRLHIEFRNSTPPITIETSQVSEDADRLDELRDEHKLSFGVFRPKHTDETTH